MRSVLPIGAAASMLALAFASPALAAPPDLLPPAGTHGAIGGGGGGFHGDLRSPPGGGGFQGGDTSGFRAPSGGGPRNFGGGGGHFAGGGQRFGGGNFGEQHRFPHGGYGGGYRHHGGYGSAVGAGVAGFAAGALVGGALANPGPYYDDYTYDAPVYAPAPQVVEEGASDDAVAACAARFRSYDPRSQTYLGYDGMRHPCP